MIKIWRLEVVFQRGLTFDHKWNIALFTIKYENHSEVFQTWSWLQTWNLCFLVTKYDQDPGGTSAGSAPPPVLYRHAETDCTEPVVSAFGDGGLSKHISLSCVSDTSKNQALLALFNHWTKHSTQTGENKYWLQICARGFVRTQLSKKCTRGTSHREPTKQCTESALLQMRC